MNRYMQLSETKIQSTLLRHLRVLDINEKGVHTIPEGARIYYISNNRYKDNFMVIYYKNVPYKVNEDDYYESI